VSAAALVCLVPPLLPLLALCCALLQMDRNAMVGVLSMKDVVRTVFEDQKHEIDSVKDYIHGGW
jgi:hypothetical protein